MHDDERLEDAPRFLENIIDDVLESLGSLNRHAAVKKEERIESKHGEGREREGGKERFSRPRSEDENPRGEREVEEREGR